MNRRRGFTLPEVLIASLILVIALMGVGGMVAGLVRKATVPNIAEQANIYAAERLAYFRGQKRPFQAVGGTYYPPPERRDQPDLNADASYHNTGYNRHAVLFVREFLYGVDEGQSGRNGLFEPSAGEDAGYFTQSRQVQSGQNYGRNEIPPTDPKWERVIANDDRNFMASSADVGGLNPLGKVGYAPRANSDIISGSALADSVKFVREVWVQTNLPYFPTGNDAFFDNAIPNAFAPPAIGALPPYTVAVTVRVYARDRTYLKYRAADYQAVDSSGRGYDRTRPPLAEAAGYFGLRRTL